MQIYKEFNGKFQHTAARRRLARKFGASLTYFCFNTQPPEGGWHRHNIPPKHRHCFNTQPPEGGWFHY